MLPLARKPSLSARLLDEHRLLREMAARCAENPDAAAVNCELLQRLGTLLHDHIRWEEREYLETLQREHPDALADLVHEAEKIELQRPGSRARRSLDQ